MEIGTRRYRQRDKDKETRRKRDRQQRREAETDKQRDKGEMKCQCQSDGSVLNREHATICDRYSSCSITPYVSLRSFPTHPAASPLHLLRLCCINSSISHALLPISLVRRLDLARWCHRKASYKSTPAYHPCTRPVPSGRVKYQVFQRDPVNGRLAALADILSHKWLSAS